MTLSLPLVPHLPWDRGGQGDQRGPETQHKDRLQLLYINAAPQHLCKHGLLDCCSIRLIVYKLCNFKTLL